MLSDLLVTWLPSLVSILASASPMQRPPVWWQFQGERNPRVCEVFIPHEQHCFKKRKPVMAAAVSIRDILCYWGGPAVLKGFEIKRILYNIYFLYFTSCLNLHKMFCSDFFLHTSLPRNRFCTIQTLPRAAETPNLPRLQPLTEPTVYNCHVTFPSCWLYCFFPKNSWHAWIICSKPILFV